MSGDLATWRPSRKTKQKKQEKIKTLPKSQLMYYPFTLGHPTASQAGHRWCEIPAVGLGCREHTMGLHSGLRTKFRLLGVESSRNLPLCWY